MVNVCIAGLPYGFHGRALDADIKVECGAIVVSRDQCTQLGRGRVGSAGGGYHVVDITVPWQQN